jgi:hypothetical protein
VTEESIDSSTYIFLLCSFFLDKKRTKKSTPFIGNCPWHRSPSHGRLNTQLINQSLQSSIEFQNNRPCSLFLKMVDHIQTNKFAFSIQHALLIIVYLLFTRATFGLPTDFGTYSLKRNEKMASVFGRSKTQKRRRGGQRSMA